MIADSVGLVYRTVVLVTSFFFNSKQLLVIQLAQIIGYLNMFFCNQIKKNKNSEKWRF